MKSLGSLLILPVISALILSGCITTPNMKEPVFVVCTIIDGQEADCVISGNQEIYETRPVTQMIGWQCVSARSYADISNHHDAVHFELNKYIKKKK